MHEPPNGQNKFRLAQLSDPHLSSLNDVRLRELLNKRVLGYLSWRWRRRTEHTREVLSALVRDLRTMVPDHIAITGDLTHLGLPSEFRQAREWLDALGEPAAVTVVPGNHDAYVSSAWDHTLALWDPYMASDAMPPDWEATGTGHGMFPTLRIRDGAALIGLSTARPSAPFLAVGSLGSTQLQKLEGILHETGRQGLCRILLLHHPPLPGSVAWRKRLTDSASLHAVLARQGAELVLHGHAHRTSVSHLDTGSRRILTIGVPSASARGRNPDHRAQYHLYHVTPEREGWHLLVSARRYSPTDDRFTPETETSLWIPRAAS